MGSVLNLLSHVRLSVTRWTIAHQTPQSLGFSRQEYCSELPFTSPGDLPNPGIEPGSPIQADSLPPEPSEKPIEISDRLLIAFIKYIYFKLIDKIKKQK